MQVSEVLTVLRRRVIVFLLLLGIGVGISFVFIESGAARYWSRSELLFVAPGGTSVASVDGTQTEGLISFAGMIASTVNNGPGAKNPDLASSSAPLYGIGVQRGFSIQLPNLGGQWQSSFSRPVLDVEVVESSPARAERLRDKVTTRVIKAANRLQAEAGVRPRDRITVNASSGRGPIVYVGRTRSGEIRAGLALVTVIVVLSAGATIEVNRHLDKRAATHGS